MNIAESLKLLVEKTVKETVESQLKSTLPKLFNESMKTTNEQINKKLKELNERISVLKNEISAAKKPPGARDKSVDYGSTKNKSSDNQPTEGNFLRRKSSPNIFERSKNCNSSSQNLEEKLLLLESQVKECNEKLIKYFSEIEEILKKSTGLEARIFSLENAKNTVEQSLSSEKKKKKKGKDPEVYSPISSVEKGSEELKMTPQSLTFKKGDSVEISPFFVVDKLENQENQENLTKNTSNFESCKEHLSLSSERSEASIYVNETMSMVYDREGRVVLTDSGMPFILNSKEKEHYRNLMNQNY